MRGQFVIDKATDENVLFPEELGLCAKPELGSLGACHFYVTHIIQAKDSPHAHSMSRAQFDERVEFRGSLEVPEHIATFVRDYANAEDRQLERHQAKIAATPYEGSGSVLSRDITPPIYTSQHQELERRKHSIGHELFSLLAKARGH